MGSQAPFPTSTVWTRLPVAKVGGGAVGLDKRHCGREEVFSKKARAQYRRDIWPYTQDYSFLKRTVATERKKTPECTRRSPSPKWRAASRKEHALTKQAPCSRGALAGL